MTCRILESGTGFSATARSTSATSMRLPALSALSASRSRPSLGRQRLGGRADAQTGVVVRREIGLHVLLDDAPLGAAAGDRMCVDHACLGKRRGARADAEERRRGGRSWRGDNGGRRCDRERRGSAHGRRGGLDGRRGGGRRGGAGRRRRRSRWNRLALLAEISDDALHRNGRADAHDDLEQRAGVEALDFHHRLVGLGQEQHVALGDRIAFLLQPFDDGAVFGHLTEFWHDDRSDHEQRPRGSRWRRRAGRRRWAGTPAPERATAARCRSWRRPAAPAHRDSRTPSAARSRRSRR